METENKVLTLPKPAGQILLAVLGAMLLGMGVVASVGMWTDGDVPLTLVLIVSFFGVVLAAVGVVLLWGSTLRIRLFSEGIAVMDREKGVFQIPAGELRQLISIYAFNGKTYSRLIGLSAHSMEGLADKREQELRKNLFSKHNVNFRKRNANWVEIFAKEYLSGRAKHYPIQNLRQGILWLEWSPEIWNLLKQMYPGAEAVGWQRPNSTKPVTWNDRNKTDFFRGKDGQAVAPTLLVTYGLLGCMLLCLTALDPDMLLFIMVHCLLLGLLLGGVFLMVAGEGDRILLSETEIRVLRWGKTRQSLPADRIKTIFRIPMIAGSNVGYSEADMLLVTDKTMVELAQESLSTQRKCRDGENLVRIWEQLPDGEAFAALNLLRKKAAGALRWFSRDILFLHTPDREETLRQLYPEAQWIVLDRD